MEDLDLPYLIVVEDDVRPTGRLLADLASIDAALASVDAKPERFDMLLLGWRFLHESHPVGHLGDEGEVAGPTGGAGTLSLRRVDGLWHGTHAYLVTRRGARRLRRLMRREGIGGHLDHWAGEANSVEADMVVLAPPEQVFKTVGASTLGHGMGCFSCKYKDIMPYVLFVLALTWAGIALEATIGLRSCARAVGQAAQAARLPGAAGRHVRPGAAAVDRRST